MKANGNKELNMAKHIGKDLQAKFTRDNGMQVNLKVLEYSLTKKAINTKGTSRIH